MCPFALANSDLATACGGPRAASPLAPTLGAAGLPALSPPTLLCTTLHALDVLLPIHQFFVRLPPLRERQLLGLSIRLSLSRHVCLPPSLPPVRDEMAPALLFMTSKLNEGTREIHASRDFDSYTRLETSVTS